MRRFTSFLHKPAKQIERKWSGLMNLNIILKYGRRRWQWPLLYFLYALGTSHNLSWRGGGGGGEIGGPSIFFLMEHGGP